MKITTTITHEGRKYQFAAVEEGEKIRDIREQLGWTYFETLTFPKSDGENMNDWKHWFDQAGVEMNPENTTAIIERHLNGI